MEKEKLYTINEVAAMLKVHGGSVRRWIYNGKLNAKKIGYSVRVSQSNLDLFIKEIANLK
jgi:excisionase family DNA binding protein